MTYSIPVEKYTKAQDLPIKHTLAAAPIKSRKLFSYGSPQARPNQGPITTAIWPTIAKLASWSVNKTNICHPSTGKQPPLQEGWNILPPG